MRTLEAEQAVAAYIAGAGGDGNTVIEMSFTFTVPRDSSRQHRAVVTKWIYSASNYGLSVHATKPLFGRTWTIRLKGWGGGMCRWLWKGREL